MEIWKDIDGFCGYQVSNFGRVRTHNKVTSSARFPVRKWKDRIIKQKQGKDGRLRVCLWADGKEKTLLVHRLQAIAFLGKPNDPDMTVNHKDGNPLNNTVGNLEWLTRKDNIIYGFEHGQYSCAKPITIKAEYCFPITFNSRSECSRYLGRGTGYVSNRLRNGWLTLYDRDGIMYFVRKGAF